MRMGWCKGEGEEKNETMTVVDSMIRDEKK